MRDYELTLVMNPDLSGADRKKQLTKIHKIIEDLKGKVKKTDEWGKKQLAYPINSKDLGYYFFVEVKLPEKGPGELEKTIKHEKGLLRYLLVRAGE